MYVYRDGVHIEDVYADIDAYVVASVSLGVTEGVESEILLQLPFKDWGGYFAWTFIEFT